VAAIEFRRTSIAEARGRGRLELIASQRHLSWRSRCFRSLSREPRTGAFILIDEATNNTLGAGMIV